ncbi:unnamed protein product [Calypogeia fissa]
MVVTRKKLKLPNKEQHKLCMVIGVLSLVALSVLGASIAYYFTPTRLTPCELVEGLCFQRPAAIPPPVSVREFTDEEVAAFAVASEVLAPPRAGGWVPKVAFMFLTAGPLPLEFVWEKFFKGHENKYTVYVHASELATMKSVRKSKVFKGRDIPSGKVYWGGIEMIDAERRLLARALSARENQFFVLLSETCIPLHDFNYIYGSLMNSTYSFVDNFNDPGPHGVGRYLDRMLPEIHRGDWRKGAQWFAVMRKHAVLLVLDHLYYGKFRDFCRPGDDNRNCYPDEHYVQTYLHIMDASHLSNWTVTYVDWSDGGWHPKAYTAEEITVETLERIQSIDEHVHVSSDGHATRTSVPCMWEGELRPCFLFARKFLPETAEILAKVLPEVINSRT